MNHTKIVLVAIPLLMLVAAAPLMAAPETRIIRATATVYPQIPLWDEGEATGLLPLVEPKAGFELVVVQMELDVTWAGGDKSPIVIPGGRIHLRKDEKTAFAPMGLLAPAGMLVSGTDEASFRGKRRGQTPAELAQPETRRLHHGMAFTVEKGLRKATLQFGGTSQDLAVAEAKEALSPGAAIGATVTKTSMVEGPLTGWSTGSPNAALALRQQTGKFLMVTLTLTPKEANLLDEGRRFTRVERRQFAMQAGNYIVAPSGSLRADEPGTQAPTTSGTSWTYSHESKEWNSAGSTITLCFVVPSDLKAFSLTYRGHVVASVDAVGK